MILGIDIGTSVTKSALVACDGTSSHHASAGSELIHLGDGRVEQDLDAVVASVAGVVRTTLAEFDGHVEAVALTGQGDGLWLRDEEGRAVRPPISWMDARAAALVSGWSEGGRDSVADALYRLTGSGLFPGSHAGLLAWLARYEPESLERAAVAGYCTDAVAQVLTGHIVTEASDASLPFLDVRTRTYVDAAVELVGLAPWRHLLIDPVAPGSVLTLNRRGAELLGLPVGTPITVGPYDLQACGYGAGASRAGDGTVVVGTTLSCQVLTTDTTITPESEPAGMWLCTPEEGLFLRVMPTMVGTATIDWLMGLFGRSAGDLSELLSASPPGARGVRTLPFLSPAGERAPFVDPLARGQFTGLSLNTGAADMVRALSESIAYTARRSFEYMGLNGELSACGGGLRSDAWTQLFADVTGRDINIPLDPQVGIRGAALVAWRSLGNPVDEAAWRMQRRVVRPRTEHAAAYERGYERYRDDLAEARQAWNRS